MNLHSRWLKHTPDRARMLSKVPSLPSLSDSLIFKHALVWTGCCHPPTHTRTRTQTVLWRKHLACRQVRRHQLQLLTRALLWKCACDRVSDRATPFAFASAGCWYKLMPLRGINTHSLLSSSLHGHHHCLTLCAALVVTLAACAV